MALDDGYGDHALLLNGDAPDRPAWHDTVCWRAVHALGFATGGITFILGTGAYWLPQTPLVGNAAAILYIVGSLGFLSVDVLEFFTFTECPLRLNISLSAIGSTAYVVGSAGFLPAVMGWSPAIGIWGFIVGSAFIFVSQCWKVARFATPAPSPEDEEEERHWGCAKRWCARWPSLRTVFASADTATATGVEFGACLGALGFLVGTGMFEWDDSGTGWWWQAVLILWMAGSVSFTVGAAFLAYRHFVMRVT